jgi:carbon-monoxide dehydrogenase large subunit/6-hydroxypseudooxynicotine dehydrogenase subunit gamma
MPYTARRHPWYRRRARSGDYAGLLDKALAAVKWNDLTADLQRRRANGECVGAGLAFFVEKSGLGPFDAVRVSVDTSGLVEVVTGAASLGQGLETVVAQICADALGVDYRRVRVVHGRTDQIAFGMGAFASRATVMTGEATRLAAVEVRAKAIEIAAELMQQPADGLEIVDGEVVRKSGELAAGPSMKLAEIAKALEPASKLRARALPGFARRLVLQRPHDPTACTSRSPTSIAQPAPPRSSVTSLPMTSAAPSIPCWWKASSPAALRKAWAAR